MWNHKGNHRNRFDLVAVAGISLALGVAAAACAKEAPKTDEATPAKTEEAPKKVEAPKAQPAPKTPAAGAAPTLADSAGTYNVDISHSAVIFRAKHMGASYTYGSFNKVEGTVKIDPDPTKSEVSVDIDTNSLFSGDKKRDDHLKGPDFLNVKQFPKITFKSTAIKAAGAGKYEVTGNLTLHGVTKPVTAVFDHIGFGPHPLVPNAFVTGFHSSLTIKRSDYEIKHMIGKGISDEIDLMISIEAIRK